MSSKGDSKTDSFVKLAIFLFVTLLSFSVGIFAGKKFSDNQHALAALEPQKGATREVASAHEEGHDSKPSAMTDEEIAKLAEEFVADETTPAHSDEHEAPHKDAHAANDGHGTTPTAPSHAAPAHAASTKTPAAHPAPAPSHAETAKAPAVATANSAPAHQPSKAAQNLAAGKTPATAVAHHPAAQAPQNRIPNALPKEVGAFNVGKFTVQVASYGDEAEAQKMASDLKSKGYSAYYIPAKVNGKTWYRVSVGQFATQKDAQSYRSQFMQKSKVESAIVQKITQ